VLELSVTHIRPGNCVKLDRGIYEVTNYEHVKPGKGGAFVRLKLKHMENGTVLEKTLDADAQIAQVEVVDHKAQYLFKSGDICTFMNTETFDQVEMPMSAMGKQAGFLIPDIEVKLMECEGRILGISFPAMVDLKVTSTPPGVKGDTVSRGTKPATLESGFVVNVPLFINQGDTIRLDTRSGEYVERM
jgi:elongation factor P